MKTIISGFLFVSFILSQMAVAETVEVYKGESLEGLGGCALEVVRDDNGKIVIAGDEGLFFGMEMAKVDGRYIGSIEAGASLQTFLIEVRESELGDIPVARTVQLEPLQALKVKGFDKKIEMTCANLKLQAD